MAPVVCGGIKVNIPNWISENDWTPEKRLYWANTIMSFSSRDWSIKFNHGDIPKSPDAEVWKIWCLITQDTKRDALKCWQEFCEQYHV